MLGRSFEVPRSKPTAYPSRCRVPLIGLVLLCGSSSVAGCASLPKWPRPPCVEQSAEALIEIATGQLEDYAQHDAAWEREQARACGWVTEADYADPE